MNETVLYAGLLGIGCGLGLTLLLYALRAPSKDASTEVEVRGTSRLGFGGQPLSLSSPHVKRLLICAAVALVVAVVSGWPVAGLLAGGAAWVLPGLLGPDRVHQQALARIEAIATWTESVRDTLGGAAGLEQAIGATAHMAPAAISGEVTRLAARLRRGDRLPDTLRAFATELDDPTADLVIISLVMAAERHARNVGVLLGKLSTTAREQASLRMRVAAGRARFRTVTKVVIIVILGMAVGLAVLDADYLKPLDTVVGQLALTFVGVCFTGGILWMRRLAAGSKTERVLAPAATVTLSTPANVGGRS